MKTTAVRKLLPESFGFLCPVHTPDGAPCGLLNHLAAKATVVTHNTPHALHRLPELLAALGMTPSAGTGLIPPHDQLPITVDGRIIGYAPINIAVRIVHALRLLKVEGYRRTEAAAKLEAWETTREQVQYHCWDEGWCRGVTWCLVSLSRYILSGKGSVEAAEEGG